MAENTGEIEIVMVPVPVGRLEEVYRLLGNGGPNSKAPTGESAAQFAGMVGALGKRCQSRYDKPSLPFEVRWDGSQCQYRFEAAAAEAVKAAL